MDKPIITQLRLKERALGVDYYNYTIRYTSNLHQYHVVMSEECASQLQQYITNMHICLEVHTKSNDPYDTGTNMDTQRGDYQPPVEGDEAGDGAIGECYSKCQ